MQRSPRISDAREFCKQYDMGEDCLVLAELHPRLYDFWERCERFDWMLNILHATGYRNGNELLRVFDAIASERKNKYRLSEDCDEPYKSLLEDGDGLDENDKRSLKWCKNYVVTDLYDKETTGFDALLDLAARSDLAAREGHDVEVSQDSDMSKAVIESEASIRKHRAQLLRDLLGNPYDGSRSKDFD